MIWLWHSPRLVRRVSVTGAASVLHLPRVQRDTKAAIVNDGRYTNQHTYTAAPVTQEKP